MKLRIYSDLHLDHYNTTYLWEPPEMPDDSDTILILAGDVWIGTRWIKHADTSWISRVAPRFKYVLKVLGNHSYWPQGDLTIKNGAAKCNKMLYDMGIYNVKVLDCDTFESDGILFVGATLWTNMNRFSPLAMMNMPNSMAYDGKIAYETAEGGKWSRFTSEKWCNTHMKHVDYIKHIAAQNRDKKVVMITHHLPLESLCDPQFVGDPNNAYYASDLSSLILDNDNIKFWVCGHSHHSNDTMFEQCRMYMNPVGYQGEHREQCGLVKHEEIEV